MACYWNLSARCCAGAAPAAFMLALAVAASLPDLTLTSPVAPTLLISEFKHVLDKYLRDSRQTQVYTMRTIPGENRGIFELMDVERSKASESTPSDSLCGEEVHEVTVQLPWGGSVTHEERRCVQRGELVLDFPNFGLTCEDNVQRRKLATYTGSDSQAYGDVEVYGSAGCVLKRKQTRDSHCCKILKLNASFLCLRKGEYDDLKSKGLVQWSCD